MKGLILLISYILCLYILYENNRFLFARINKDLYCIFVFDRRAGPPVLPHPRPPREAAARGVRDRQQHQPEGWYAW